MCHFDWTFTKKNHDEFNILQIESIVYQYEIVVLLFLTNYIQYKLLDKAYGVNCGDI